MRVCGIVSEYNPFHNGHAYHIARTREALGAETIIVACMTGNFVQRGEAALAPKHLRARMACQGGADLVVELPTPYALSSAEGFAQASIHLLDSLGVVTDISFGAEDADVALLDEIARTLLEQRTIADTLTELKRGIPYAAARERALYRQLKEKSAVIARPNNILAIEYIKALIARGSRLMVHAIERRGAGHDSAETGGGLASASHIRRLMRESGPEVCRDFISPQAQATLSEAARHGHLLLDTGALHTAMLPHLLRLTPEDLARLPGAAEGIEHRLHRAIGAGRTWEGVLALAKTKRYPLARLRRMLFCAYLGIEARHTAAPPSYIRVLAMNDRGRRILRRATEVCALPLITKPARARAFDGTVRDAFERECLMTDLYQCALPAGLVARGADWRASAAYIPGGE